MRKPPRNQKPRPVPEQKLEKAKPFLYSLGLHGFLLFILAGGLSLGLPHCGKGSAQAQAQAEAEKKAQEQAEEESKKKGTETLQVELGDILPKPQEAQEPDDEQPLTEDGLFQKAHAAQKCPDFYGGIGIVWGYGVVDASDLTKGGKYVVETVYPGYPAARHGILAGDEPVDEDGRPLRQADKIRGKVGTPVTVSVRREGQILTFTMIREKICIDKKQKKQMEALDRLNSIK